MSYCQTHHKSWPILGTCWNWQWRVEIYASQKCHSCMHYGKAKRGALPTFQHSLTWPMYSHTNDVLLNLPMLRLLSSNAQERKYFWKPSKPCHVGIHWITLTEYSQMSTHMSGFMHYFVLANLATSSIRVNTWIPTPQFASIILSIPNQRGKYWIDHRNWHTRKAFINQNQRKLALDTLYGMRGIGLNRSPPLSPLEKKEFAFDFIYQHKDAKIFEKYLNHVMLVFIG